MFWQGHPEYDRDTLAREFRRDVLRYLSGERRAPAAAPHGISTRRLRRAFNLRLQERATNLSSLETVAAALKPEELSPAVAEWRARPRRG